MTERSHHWTLSHEEPLLTAICVWDMTSLHYDGCFILLWHHNSISWLTPSHETAGAMVLRCFRGVPPLTVTLYTLTDAVQMHTHTQIVLKGVAEWRKAKHMGVFLVYICSSEFTINQWRKFWNTEQCCVLKTDVSKQISGVCFTRNYFCGFSTLKKLGVETIFTQKLLVEQDVSKL